MSNAPLIHFWNTTTTSGSGNGTSIYVFQDDFTIQNRETNGVISFLTANTERLRITSAGKVGIGTSSPGAKTEIVSSGAETSLILRNNSSAMGSYGEIKFAPFTGTTAASASIRAEYYQDNDSTLAFRTTNANSEPTTKLFIDASGRVGIGTTPTTDILEIYGNLRFAQVSNYLKFANDSITIKRNGANALEFNSYNGFLFNDTLNSTERARIDSSGRLLVGTSTARSNFYNGTSTNRLQIEGTTFENSGGSFTCNNALLTQAPIISLNKSAGGSVGSNTLVSSGSILGLLTFQGNDGTEFVQAADIKAEVDGTPGANDMPGRLVFSTTADGAASPTEAMRITSAGLVLIGTQTAYSTGATIGGGEVFARNTSARSLTLRRDTTDGTIAEFRRDATTVGTISVTTIATAYNTSSDYRLKENVAAVTDGITRLQQLKPSRFNFVSDPAKTVDGFLAHEAAEIVPECVTGEKDAVDDDGNPIYQGIDQSKLVPLLTAALQEAIAKIETLEARLTAAGIE
jgi:hypothetical protein